MLLMTLAELEASISDRLRNDAMRNVLTGAMDISRGNNPIRGNLFAAGIRELLTWYLHELAPNDMVKACSWYVKETDDGKPTRSQRQRYVIQGGLSDEYVTGTLKIDIDYLRTQLREAFEALNKATHVREDTIITADEDVAALVESSLGTLSDLMDAVDLCRDELLTAVSTAVSDQATQEIMRDTIAEIDDKATHHFIEFVGIDEIYTERIDATHVWYKVRGSIDAELQFGSGSDFLKGDGATVDHNFPFTCRVAAPVSDPKQFDPDMSELIVEDGGWYD
jgi:hypothetical protein